jgi:hypothetical protein
MKPERGPGEKTEKGKGERKRNKKEHNEHAKAFKLQEQWQKS